MAMLACARIGAIHSVVFGGFAAPELATRIDDAKPAAILSASCGIEPGRVVHYKPLLDAAIELATHKPKTVLMLQRPMARSVHDCGARPRLGDGDGRRQGARPQGRVRLGRGHRPALHPLHLGHDRPAQGRGARQRRAHGGAQVDHEEPLRRRAPARRSGPPPTSAGWSGIPTSATRRCCTAARRSCSRASPSARRTPARSGA